MLEIGLTISVFLSSFLIITIEKDWWGGYLTSDKNSHSAKNFQEWLKNGKKMRAPNPTYVFENTIRLIIIGSSISFFLLMCLMELVQCLVTAIYTALNRIGNCVKKLFSSSPMMAFSSNMYNSPNVSKQGGSDYKSSRQLEYETTIIISNL